MCNKEHLVGYLYDELTSTEKAAFEAHIAACAECRQEVGALRQTRQHLASWSPPEPEFNFTIVQTRATEPSRPSSRWVPFLPQWALAAAAALIVVAGAAAIANIEVRHDDDGSLVLRTGWSPRPAATEMAPVAPADAMAAASEELKTELAALRRRLEEVELSFQKVQSAEQMRVAGSIRAGISTSELRKILAESEARVRTEMAAHTAQIWRDVSAARVNDLARMQQQVQQVQGFTNRQLLQQRESIDSLRYLHTVSQQK